MSVSRRFRVAARIVLALLAAGCVGAGTATATPGTTTMSREELCDRLSWPRPMPNVVGLIFEDTQQEDLQPLACLTGLRGIGPDGTVVWEKDFYKVDADSTFDRIAAVTPPPGALVGRNDPVTVNLVPINLDDPPAHDPCAWMSTAEASAILGGGPIHIRREGRGLQNFAGSTDLVCYYDSSDYSHVIESELRLTDRHIVDALSEFAFRASRDSTPVDGVGVKAACGQVPRNNHIQRLYVVLPGERLYIATGWGEESCDTLKRFAQAAIPRIAV